MEKVDLNSGSAQLLIHQFKFQVQVRGDKELHFSFLPEFSKSSQLTRRHKAGVIDNTQVKEMNLFMLFDKDFNPT